MLGRSSNIYEWLANVYAEVLALISLKKFRHLRRSYHANEGPR